MNAKSPLGRAAQTLLLSLLLVLSGRSGAAEAPRWSTHWSQALFDQATREHRYVILDLQAVWCHWCHVMEQQTYADPRVRQLLAAHYVAVKVDQDGDPELSDRYGDWGWPATIIFAPDGSELVKRRGFIPPENMVSLLQAVVDDPTPGPSVSEEPAVAAAAQGALGADQRAALRKQLSEIYDAPNGGWGEGLKFIDADAMEWAIGQRGDAEAEQMARHTLDANLALIDPVWGGVYQYSEKPDWSAPHFEKLMSFQADDLRLYSLAYARWREPKYLQAAQAIQAYLEHFLKSPAGAYYVSQDADLSATVSGHDYYTLDETARLALGQPRVDTHVYTRENGWAIAALCRYSDISGDAQALQGAVQAALWVRDHRGLAGGGWRHDSKDRAGPYLGDSVAMAQALLGLYRSTGERQWLDQATATLGDIERQFHDARGGYFSVAAPKKAIGVFSTAVRVEEENVALVRAANLAWRYTADPRWQHLAEHGMRYLAAPELTGSGRFLPGVLLAGEEFAVAPVHITVVGAKSDPAAQRLHAAALRYPTVYLRVDWWDRKEGQLPNPDIQYPALPRAAAYACSEKACSSPVFDADKLVGTVERLRKVGE